MTRLTLSSRPTHLPTSSIQMCILMHWNMAKFCLVVSFAASNNQDQSSRWGSWKWSSCTEICLLWLLNGKLTVMIFLWWGCNFQLIYHFLLKKKWQDLCVSVWNIGFFNYWILFSSCSRILYILFYNFLLSCFHFWRKVMCRFRCVLVLCIQVLAQTNWNLNSGSGFKSIPTNFTKLI